MAGGCKKLRFVASALKRRNVPLKDPLPGDDKRAEDILDEIHVIFTRTNARLRWDGSKWRIDAFKTPPLGAGAGPMGNWMSVAEFPAGHR